MLLLSAHTMCKPSIHIGRAGKVKLLILCLSAFLLSSCAVRPSLKKTSGYLSVRVDLSNITNDKVRVEVLPPAINRDTISYHFAHIIPGTYAVADYGRFVEEVRAFDQSGANLPVRWLDSNTIEIADAKRLKSLSYLVNDTFDQETGANVFGSGEKVIFSPAGTNILADTHFWVNWCGFLGYFDDLQEQPYQVSVKHPPHLYGSTASFDRDTSAAGDLFYFARFAEAVDNPVMYCKPDTAMFRINDMEVLLSVYAPHRNTSAEALKPALEKMMVAQKKFLGKLNTTKKYAVLAYLTTAADGDARGIGALEHNNSTTAVFRESMTSQDLIHVISHEFFHTVTPLKVHSEEIRYFDFQNPKMSRHLWFYEGVTEYFANLFQVNQALIPENNFYDLMSAKIKAAEEYNDSLSFTVMSKDVLKDSMKREYPNVYQKGALLAMCLDIVLREHSGGKKGLFNLMEALVDKYGTNKPFVDEDFIGVISEMTFPEAGAFLNTHVVEGKPVDYLSYLKRMGLSAAVEPVSEPIVFVSHDALYINIDDEKKQVVVAQPDNKNQFFSNLGLKDNDVLLRMNGLAFNAEDGSASLMLGYGLTEGAPVVLEILRDGTKLEVKGTVKLNYTDEQGFRFTDSPKLELKNAWLKK